MAHIRSIDLMRRLKYIVAFLTGMSLVCLQAQSQSSQPVLTQLTTNEGLSFNTVEAIHQDNYGFMWFLTWKGIDRYDGIEFLNYRALPERRQEDGTTIAEDSLGNLWYGDALSMYKRADDLAGLFIHPVFGEEWSPGKVPRTILMGSDNHMYLATFRIILKMDRYDAEFAVDTLLSLESSHPFQRITKIQFDKEDHLWIGTDEGLYTYQSGKDTVLWFDRMRYMEDRYIHDFIFDFEGNLWVVFTNDLIKYDFDQKSTTHFRLPDEEGAVFSTVYQTNDGAIWLGTVENGLYFLSPGQSHFECLLDHLDIAVIHEDRSGRLWIGTQNAGIFLYDPLRNFYRQLPLKLENQTLTSLHINKVLSDGESGLWISSHSLGLLYHHFKTGLTSFNDRENNQSNLLYKDRQGKIWYHSMGFLVCYNSEDRSIRKIRHPVSDQFPVRNEGNTITGMCSFRDKLVFSSDKGEVYAFDPEKEEFSLIIDNNGSPIRTMMPEKDTLWLALYHVGVIRVDSSFAIIDTLYHDNSQKGLIGYSMMALHRDRFDTVWIGGDGGLCKLNPHTMEFEGVYDFHGSSGYVTSILEDQQGNLWIGGSNGIYRYDRENTSFTLMDSNHGMPTGRFFSGCATQTPDGVMYFGGNNGIVYFQPEEVRLNSEVPPLVITGFHLNVKGRRDSPGDIQELPPRIIQQEEIHLKYWQNSFTIKYASLNYTSPQHNQYRYILSGLEDNWNEVGNQSQAIYTNLRGRRYLFKVMGSNNDGLWNEAAISIPIRIDPPPWFSWWAITLYTILVLSAVLFIYSYNLRRIRMQHELELKSKESESLKEIDRAKSNFFTNISHEFRTPLTLIQDPAEQIFKDRKTLPGQKKLADLILKNARRLLNMTNQILDLAKLENSQINLRVEEVDLPVFITPIAHSFQSRAESLELEYRIVLPERSIRIWIDKDRIEQVLINLLSNAFKYCFNGEIVLEVSDEKDAVLIQVRDTGIGIPPEHIDQIFDNYYQVDTPHTKDMAGTGIGLFLVREFVGLHSGSVNVSSEVGRGSRFSVRIPKGKDHFRPEQIESGSQPKEKKTIVDLELQWQGQESINLPSGKSKPKLLVVEDTPEMAQYLLNVLSEECMVHLAKDGSEGFEKSLQLNPDLVISDIMMPRMDGYRFCELLKQDMRTSHIPIILLTARNMHKDKIKGLELGADDYLEKPFHLNELKLRISYHLEQRKNFQEEFLKKFRIHDEMDLTVSMKDQFLQKTHANIEEHLHDDQFGVEKLSDLLGMSRKHLNNKIKSLTNQTTNELIRNFRLRKAAYLLSENGISVSQACYQAGFNNLSYFSKCFAEFYGKRPSEYNK